MPAYSHLLDEERDQIAAMKAAGRSICAIASASPVAAQPYYGEAPPITVYALPPPPPVAVGQAIGGLVGGIVSLPFTVLGAIFAPPVPLVPDGQGGWVPETNSRYDPVTGQFLPPYPAPSYSYRDPPTYAPQEPYPPPPPPNGRRSGGKGHSGGGGCFASDGTPPQGHRRMRNEPAADPGHLPVAGA